MALKAFSVCSTNAPGARATCAAGESRGKCVTFARQRFVDAQFVESWRGALLLLDDISEKRQMQALVSLYQALGGGWRREK